MKEPMSPAGDTYVGLFIVYMLVFPLIFKMPNIPTTPLIVVGLSTPLQVLDILTLKLILWNRARG